MKSYKAHTLFTVLYDKKFEISVRTNIYFGQNRIRISIFGGKYSNIRIYLNIR